MDLPKNIIGRYIEQLSVDDVRALKNYDRYCLHKLTEIIPCGNRKWSAVLEVDEFDDYVVKINCV